ncbi:MAG: 4Fe-4S dicluster domain-containing protein [Candidatus Aenigmarchaeota archaeon]|nr:4Fe-4S dicluster domain-containing protein [Candidatus Aenigmarchaeota archaeon]
MAATHDMNEKPAFYTIKKADFGKFFESLTRKYKVFAPVEAGDEHNFRQVKTVSEMKLGNYVNVEFPPKKFLHPNGLLMMEFAGSRVRQRAKTGKIALFGVRPCDTHALDVLDRVMTDGYVDAYYKKARGSTLILALNCKSAGDECFCGSMGTDKAIGFDLLFTETGNGFHVEVGSEKGHSLVNNKLFRKTGSPAAKAKLVFRKQINTENLEEVMRSSFSSEFWDETAKRCLSCASCTSVCPTCYCFDVHHDAEPSEKGIEKVNISRTWNYCMLQPFTRVAGGEVTRESRTERVKQFFYHKLLYGKENQGKLHCVGCGRCIRECMTKIDITEEAAKARSEYESKK